MATYGSLKVGTPVTVYSFGVHPGVVVGHDPVLTIQNRTMQHTGWVTVRIPGKPMWNGDPKHVDVTKQITKCRKGR